MPKLHEKLVQCKQLDMCHAPLQHTHQNIVFDYHHIIVRGHVRIMLQRTPTCTASKLHTCTIHCNNNNSVIWLYFMTLSYLILKNQACNMVRTYDVLVDKLRTPPLVFDILYVSSETTIHYILNLSPTT